MTTTTVTLADFLLARIAEDERYATHAGGMLGVEAGANTSAHVNRWRPSRVLAECDAKRRVLDRSVPFRVRDYADMTLRLLALPYADHPDYREEWRA